MDIHQHAHFLPFFSSTRVLFHRCLWTVSLSRGQSVGSIRSIAIPRSPAATPSSGQVRRGSKVALEYQLVCLPSRGLSLGGIGEEELHLTEIPTEKTLLFPPVSLPLGSLYPREEVCDSHGRGHLAAPSFTRPYLLRAMLTPRVHV